MEGGSAMRRIVSVLVVMALMTATAAVPALAAKPDTDAKGCENNNARQLDEYCSTD